VKNYGGLVPKIRMSDKENIGGLTESSLLVDKSLAD